MSIKTILKRLEDWYSVRSNERVVCAALVVGCAFVFFRYGNPWFIYRESTTFNLITAGSVSVAYVAVIRFFQGNPE